MEKEKKKIAVTYENGNVFQHFGHTEQFKIYEISDGKVEKMEKAENINRKKGIASEMITYAEDYCTKNYPLHKYELLTGKKNVIAQFVYGKLGYADDGEIHLSKRIKR